MKKKINGKFYDSDKDYEIAYWDNGIESVTDLMHCDEILLRCKDRNELYIYSYGGPQTDLATYDSTGAVIAGEKIEPINDKQAIEWMSEKLPWVNDPIAYIDESVKQIEEIIKGE